jgi:hypothetical protein
VTLDASLAAALSSDNTTALGLGAVGLMVTVGCIVGIVALATRVKSQESTGNKVAIVLAMGCLGVFALGGLFLTGCGAMIAH